MTIPAPGWAAAAAEWERTLRLAGTARAASEKAYLKSDLDFAGTGIPAIRAMVDGWCKTRPALQDDQLTGLVTALWASPLYECRQAAVVLLERTSRLLGPGRYRPTREPAQDIENLGAGRRARRQRGRRPHRPLA